MNPILKYLKDFFAERRILASDAELKGFVRADMLLKKMVSSRNVPGIAVTVLKDGKTIFQKGYGYASIEKKSPIHPNKTVFRIASVSKPIAATALAYLVQEGLINLDTSFYTYVPDYPKKRWDFTIRQLASHTAGIRGYQGKEYGLNEPYSIQDSLKIFKEAPLLYKPGTAYFYTSFDWVMIAVAMQNVSGIPFEKYVQDRLLGPLGMEHTYIPKPPVLEGGKANFLKDTTPIATFYSKGIAGFRKAIPVDNFYKLAGGGYLATSVDIATFGQSYLDKKIKVNQALLDQFLTAEKVTGKSTYYGLGWQVSQDAKGRKFFGHIGNGVGGYANFFVYPKEQVVISILINCTDPKVQPVLDEIVDCFF